MHVTLRYFAALREITGRTREDVTLPEAATLAAARAWLAAHYPAAAAVLPRCVAARNHAFAPDDTPLAAGDEIAFLPPMAGGQGAGGRRVT